MYCSIPFIPDDRKLLCCQDAAAEIEPRSNISIFYFESHWNELVKNEKKGRNEKESPGKQRQQTKMAFCATSSLWGSLPHTEPFTPAAAHHEPGLDTVRGPGLDAPQTPASCTNSRLHHALMHTTRWYQQINCNSGDIKQVLLQCIHPLNVRNQITEVPFTSTDFYALLSSHVFFIFALHVKDIIILIIHLQFMILSFIRTYLQMDKT